MSSDTDMQIVWRNYSAPKFTGAGYYIWDVTEVIGEPFKEKYFTKCRDGSFIIMQCFHTFTEEKALEMFNDPGFDLWQTIIQIRPELVKGTPESKDAQ
jgi:hypothetical protein